MPFLKLLQSMIPVIKAPPSLPEPLTKQITIKFAQESLTEVAPKPSPKNISKQKGDKYEEYVGHLYENEGYSVEYNGKNKGGHDLGRDLICKIGEEGFKFTVVVQCKNYLETSYIGVNEIYKFYGSVRHYAIEHPNEVVQGAIFTPLNMRDKCKEAYRAAIVLGIVVYDDVFILEQ